MKVKEILKDKNITAKELATQMGMSEAGLSVALSEKGNPSLSTLRKIAEALNVKVSDLVREDGDAAALTCPKCGAELKLSVKE